MRRQCRFLLEEYFSSRGRIIYSALETLRHLIGLRPTPQEWFQNFFKNESLNENQDSKEIIVLFRPEN